MFREPRAIVHRPRPITDHGRLHTRPSQAPYRNSTDAAGGRPEPTPQGLTGHWNVCADADGSSCFIWHVPTTTYSFGLAFLVHILYTDGFKHLQAHVATAAFDSNDNVDAPKCHPNTRKVAPFLFNLLLKPSNLYIYSPGGTG